MGSATTPKRPRMNEDEEEASADRLSNLPDSILHHILSLMDAKYAVQSCVLSSRYKYLWRSLPSLNFDSESFCRLADFERLVTEILFRCHPYTVFSLNFSRRGTTQSNRLKSIVRYARSHNVQHLKFSSFGSLKTQKMCLPHNLFTSETVKTGWGCLQSSKPFIFPSLTSLHLENVSFRTWFNSSECSLYFSGCPNLKSLSLISFHIGCLKLFHLDIPQILNLTLGLCYFYSSCNCKVVVTAPNLTHLNYQGTLPIKLCADNLPSLVKVDISGQLYTLPGKEDHERMKMNARDLISMLRECSNAKFLTLSTGFIVVLSMVPDLLEHLPSPFSNLKSLKLKGFPRHTTSKVFDNVITYLLSSSPGTAVVESS